MRMLTLAVLCFAVSAKAAEPYLDTTLPPDARAAAWAKVLTRDEKLRLVHGYFASTDKPTVPPGVPKIAGYVPGIARVKIPALLESDASLGVANQLEARKGDVATALPSGLALASSFDMLLAYEGGAMIGSEARSKGFNVLLAGGVNLTREPRNGRNFEYLGEDPWLAGKMAGASIRGVQSNNIVSTIKHFALNAQETGRMVLSAKIDEPALRESDLLAFEIAIEDGRPGAVMCAYNRVNGVYACENAMLLTQVLKRDWKYPGWVMSDWGAVHGAAGPIKAGLDQESGEELDTQVFFGQPLVDALKSDAVTDAELDAMVQRILRSVIAVGLIERPVPAAPETIDYVAHAKVAQQVAEEGAVLLKNEGAVLPFGADVKRIVLIGGHADVGVLSGGGSSQVRAVAGVPVEIPLTRGPSAAFCRITYHGASPLAAFKARGIEVDYDDGSNPQRAASLAAKADAALVFATQWNTEASDVPNLKLDGNQDALISAVARANKRTVVVLETGNPVLMPWLSRVPGVLEVWYAGEKGGDAIARLVYGDVNPSGHLPMTFPAREADLPNPVLPKYLESEKAIDASKPLAAFDVAYPERADVGYRWFAAKGRKPLFPFGYGLSYTTFAIESFASDGVHAHLDVVNTGKVRGAAVPQIYATPPGGRPRLVGFSRVELEPGERKTVNVIIDQRLLSRFDGGAWLREKGSYALTAGFDSSSNIASVKASLPEERREP